MTTVMDHARPWLMPSRALAATIQPQFGATAISTGTGSATAQPAMSRRRRPARAASAPAARLVSALAIPKATMNDSTAALEASPNSSRPTSGSVERSRPTIAPTNALTATSSENCAAFSRSPSRTPRSRGFDQRAPGTVGGDDRPLLLGGGRDVGGERPHEGVLGVELERAVVTALEADRR